jgi:hypothetical protein
MAVNSFMSSSSSCTKPVDTPKFPAPTVFTCFPVLFAVPGFDEFVLSGGHSLFFLLKGMEALPFVVEFACAGLPIVGV